ncbi:MAG TPA: DUF1491 family protein [Caulobacteraceae bacterium]
MLLSTQVWVMALIRRAELAGAFATVVRKGDVRAGAVLVRCVSRAPSEVRLFAEAIRGDGERVWMQPLPRANTSDLEAYIDRAARIDPDLWVVEIEDVDGARLLTEQVEKS